MSAERKTVAADAPSLAMRAAAARRTTAAVARKPPRPADTSFDACGLPHPGPIVGAMDVSSFSLAELRGMHDIARTISDVAAGIGCQPRCVTDREAGFALTRVGLMADWFGETAGHIMGLCQDESRARDPRNADEAIDRLAVIAVRALDDEGVNELAAEVVQALRVGA